MTNRKSFDYLILFFIGINCFLLALERPSIAPNSLVNDCVVSNFRSITDSTIFLFQERHFITYGHYVFTLIFTVEMMIKVISYGFVLNNNSYLRSGWNRMDFILVITSLIDVITMIYHSGESVPSTDSSTNILSMLRVFRILRALRVLTGKIKISSNNLVHVHRVIYNCSDQSSTRSETRG